MRYSVILLLLFSTITKSYCQENIGGIFLISNQYEKFDVSYVTSTITRIQELDILLEKNKNDIDLLRKRGKLFLDINFLYAALTDLKTVVAKEHLDGNSHFLIGDIFYRNKNYSQAIQSYKKAEQSGYEPDKMKKNIFLLHTMNLNFDSAQLILPQLNKADNEAILFHYTVSGQYEKAKQFIADNSMEQFEDLINDELEYEDIYKTSITQCINNGLFEQGLRLIQQIGPKEEISDDIKILKADCLLKQGKFNDAEIILFSVVNTCDNEDVKHLALYKLGGLYDWSNQPKKATEYYLKSLEIKHNEIHSLNDLSITYNKIGDHKNEFETLHRLHNLDSENLDNTNRLGIFYKDQIVNYDSSVYYFTLGYNLNKGYYRTLVNIASFELSNLNFDVALTKSFQSLASQSNYSFAIESIQDISFEFKDLDLSCRILKEKSFQIKNDLKTVEQICQYCKKDQRDDLASNSTYTKYIEYLQNTIEFDSTIISKYPKSWDAQMSSIRINYQSLKNFNKASNSLDYLLSLNSSNDADLYQMKGTMFDVWMPNPDSAIHHFGKALELNPNYFICYQKRGTEYVKIKEWNKAISDYKKFLEFGNLEEFQIAMTHLELLKLYTITKQEKEVIASANVVLNFAPYNRTAIQTLININKGTSSHNLIDLKTRLTNLKKID